MTDQERVIAEFNRLKPLSDERPDDRYNAFIAGHADEIRAMILRRHNSSAQLKQYAMRVGFVCPRHAVIDEKIKGLCCLPYARPDGRREPCGGITGNRKGCPPYSPKVVDTIKQLEESAVFLILQFEMISDTVAQKHIHNFTVGIERELAEKQYAVVQTFCCGPCRVCADGCTKDEACRHPQTRRFALEACGFWVNTLCEKAAAGTISGNDKWKIAWVKNWGLPSQTPHEFKSMSGLLLK